MSRNFPTCRLSPRRDCPVLTVAAGVVSWCLQAHLLLSSQKSVPDVQKLLRDPEFQEKIIARGAIPDPRGAKDWSAFVDAEVVKWGDVIKKANLKAD